ncbi:MAG: hypothetical protein WC582_04200 [Patescibacteria group bacterium]
MNMLFCALKWSGSEGEFHLYCFYFPLLFSITFILNLLFAAISVLAERSLGEV